jgi:hypothetical protein
VPGARGLGGDRQAEGQRAGVSPRRIATRTLRQSA